VNLPNAITIGRIAAAPVVAWLPFVPSWGLRLGAFVLFVVMAVSDYYDGVLARERNLVTNLGKLLDPLADKLFVIATFIPMYALMERSRAFPFLTPLGEIGFPLWAMVVIIAREIFVTAFRQFAARRGVVIAAIRSAKWKTGFQFVWVGAAYFWFWAATAATRYDVERDARWLAFAHFNGIVGVVTMYLSVALALYSMVLYLARYGSVLVPGRSRT
jgi:CDP-diacylglycerol---glycerol-3-phosphate 3-phosphatidyltransferase